MQILYRLKDRMRLIRNQNYELLWAKVWDDTKKGIVWVENMPGISPGRWAVGYNYLYVMTRILNEKKPVNVLECGLGISSTLISHYFSGENVVNGNHDVIEHDSNWVHFYSINNRISPATTIHTVECIEKEYKGKKYNAYKDISGIVNGKKYDVISIDGPKGRFAYSRRDIIDYIPEILNESFVIVIDDTERHGEQVTVRDIENILKEKNIEFCKGIYEGMSRCTILTSKDNKFLCTM